MNYKISRSVVYSLITGFLAACTMMFILVPDQTKIFSKEYLDFVNLPVLLIMAGGFALSFFFFFRLKNRIYRQPIVYIIFFLGALISANVASTSVYFATVLCGVLAWLFFSFKEIFPDNPLAFLKGKGLYICVGVVSAAAVAAVSAGCLLRNANYASSNFDLGLFAQMFESMATDFTQNTTLERNELVSHFTVHFSPIYYLLLPFYLPFRSVEFLIIAQSVIVASAVIPLLMLCKHWRYSEKTTFFISVVFLTYVAMVFPCFYDFHENAFLPPILLWLFYFLEKKSLYGALIFTLLSICVKEDVGLYVVIIALYFLIDKKEPSIKFKNEKNPIKRASCYIRSNKGQAISICVLLLGIAGFLFATGFVNSFGEDIKVGRYQIFLAEGEDSIANVVVNVIKNPIYFLNTLIDEKKFLFIIQMLLPLGFVPLRTKRIKDYILLLPMVLVNLATDYTYQYNVGFQYVFASGACLVFLFAKNLRYAKKPSKTAFFCAMASVLVTFSTIGATYIHHMNKYKLYAEEREATDRILSEIDEDAVVISTTYLTPHLVRCDELYMYPADSVDADVVVLDTYTQHFPEYEEILTKYLAMDYYIYKSEGWATILYKNGYLPPIATK